MKKLLPIVTILSGAVLAPLVGLYVFMQAALPLVRAKAAEAAKQTTVEAPKKPWDFWTVEMDKLSDELETKLADVEKREVELVARESRVDAAMKELVQARAEIDTLRDELGKQIGQLKESEMKNLRTLAATYGDMRPKALIPIMRELSDDTIIKILAIWKPDNVRPLLDEISKNAAADPDMVRRAGIWSERLRLLPREPIEG